MPGYTLRVTDGEYLVLTPSGGVILSGSATISTGDVWTLAAIGTTIYVIQNGTQLGSVTNSSYSSGTSFLCLVPDGSLTTVQVSEWVVGSASTTPPPPAGGQTATLNGTFYVPRPAQLFGALPNGDIAAVSTDENGNICVGNSGAINDLDVLGNLSEAMVCIIMAAVSAPTVPGAQGGLVACAVDQYGNLITSEGSAGSGTPSTTIDVLTDQGAVPVQLFGRAPDGLLIGVCASTAGALGNTLSPIENVAPGGPGGIDELSTEDGQLPIPIILCGRVVAGFSNSGQIVPVSLTSSGGLCLSGAPGASTTPPTISFNNSVATPIQLYARTSQNLLTSIPLNSSGQLVLS